MYSLEKVIPFFLFFFLLTITSEASMAQQQINDLVERPIRDFHINKSSVHSVLSNLAAKYKVPIGLEEVISNEFQPDPDITIDVQSGTIKDVLDIIINQDSRYEWEIDNGVINVIPKVRQDNILNVPVCAFEVNADNIINISRRITSLPEVKAKMKSLGISPLNLYVESLGSLEKPSSVYLKLKNVTVKYILNEIAKQSDDHYWFVGRVGDEQELLILRF